VAKRSQTDMNWFGVTMVTLVNPGGGFTPS
jgi:hypothetical protein